MSNFHLGDYVALGAFDSRNRYIRQVANPADKTINMCIGPSIGMTASGGGYARWAWVCNGIRVDPGDAGVIGAGPTGFNTGVDAAL